MGGGTRIFKSPLLFSGRDEADEESSTSTGSCATPGGGADGFIDVIIGLKERRPGERSTPIAAPLSRGQRRRGERISEETRGGKVHGIMRI